MKVFTSEQQKKGRVGEKIARQYLERVGFLVMEENYTKKTGEVDIVAEKNGVLHFVEVKTLVVTHETGYQPFQNISRSKLRKFSRTAELYLTERKVSRETKWQIDAIAVTINPVRRHARVDVLWNVIL